MASNFIENKNYSDKERWICIYPAYLNCKKTRAKGRRIPKNIAVENPTYQEIRDVLAASGFKVGVERKEYSREQSKEMLYVGRIKVQLKNNDGTPCNPQYPTRDSVFQFVSTSIPKLKTRISGKSSEQSVASSQHGSQTNKKKGKGKR